MRAVCAAAAGAMLHLLSACRDRRAGRRLDDLARALARVPDSLARANEPASWSRTWEPSALDTLMYPIGTKGALRKRPIA